MNDWINKHLEDDRYKQLKRSGAKRIVFLEKEALKLENLHLNKTYESNDK